MTVKYILVFIYMKIYIDYVDSHVLVPNLAEGHVKSIYNFIYLVIVNIFTTHVEYLFPYNLKCQGIFLYSLSEENTVKGP